MLRALLAAGVAVLAPAVAAQPASPAPRLPADLVLKVCEDDAEWPPFTYYERVNGQPGHKLTGAAVDALDRILNAAGVRYTLQMLPWKRCQDAIRSGSYHMALNASFSEERARDYRLSRPFYHLNSHYYYSRRLHPAGLDIASLADLKRHRVCGLIGYNYSTYGLAPEEMDLSPASFKLMLSKLRHGRCDLFIEKREVMAGFRLVDTAMAQELAQPELASAPLPGVPPTPFHMMVTRAHPWSEALLRVLDEGLAALEARGELQQIFGRYLR